jgi:hypothetical protein
MTTQEMISSYVNECIDNRSMGFATDFGIGKMVTTHIFYNTGEMVVTIKATKETEGFSIDVPNDIISWIYEKIK